MGAMRCAATGGRKEQNKKSPKCLNTTCFVMGVHGKKANQVVRYAHGVKRVNTINWGGNKGHGIPGKCVSEQKKPQNTPKDQTKQSNKHTAICQPSKQIAKTNGAAKEKKNSKISTPNIKRKRNTHE